MKARQIFLRSRVNFSQKKKRISWSQFSHLLQIKRHEFIRCDIQSVILEKERRSMHLMLCNIATHHLQFLSFSEANPGIAATGKRYIHFR